MQKEVETFECVHGVHFEFINSFENNGMYYLLIFDNSCEGDGRTKLLAHFTIRKHRGLSSIFQKSNLFHGSKLGRDVELQYTKIVRLKSPCNVMQVNTFVFTVGSRIELVDCYPDATTVL